MKLQIFLYAFAVSATAQKLPPPPAAPTTGALQVVGSYNGTSAAFSMNYAVVAVDGTTISGTQVPQTFSTLKPGVYTLYRFSGGMSGDFHFDPGQSVVVLPGQTATATAAFETSPSLTVRATLDGQSRSGAMSYVVVAENILEQDVTFSGASVPQVFTNVLPGDYSVVMFSGAPPNSTFVGTSSPTVTVAAGGNVETVLQFKTNPAFALKPTNPTLDAYQGNLVGNAFTITNNGAVPGSAVSLVQYILESTWPTGLRVVGTTVTMPPLGQSSSFSMGYVVPPDLAARAYPMELRATNGAVTQNADFSINVRTQAAAPFSITTTAPVVNMTAGKPATASFIIKNNSATPGTPITIQHYIWGTWPTGLSNSYPASVVMPPLGQSSTLNIALSSTSALVAQSYPWMEVAASAANLTMLADYTLSVVAQSLSVSLTASSLAPVVNTAVTITASPSGGSGSGYSCTWNISTSQACQLSYTPTSTGNQVVSVVVKDNANKTASTSITLNVQPKTAPPLTGVCQVNGSSSAQSFQVGANIVWNANITGGTDPKNFSWSGLTAGNTQSVVLVPTNGATYNASVVVADSGNPKQQITLSCPQITVVAPQPLSCGCSVTPNPITAGSSAAVSAACIGGTSPYVFQMPGSSTYGSGNVASVTPTSLGNVSYVITGKDSAGRTASGSCGLTVNAPQPALSSLMPDRTPKAAQQFNLTVYGTGFINGSQATLCGTTCYPVTTNFLDSGRLLLPALQWNAAGNVSVKVTNPGNLVSNSLVLTVSK